MLDRIHIDWGVNLRQYLDNSTHHFFESLVMVPRKKWMKLITHFYTLLNLKEKIITQQQPSLFSCFIFRVSIAHLLSWAPWTSVRVLAAGKGRGASVGWTCSDWIKLEFNKADERVLEWKNLESPFSWWEFYSVMLKANGLCCASVLAIWGQTKWKNGLGEQCYFEISIRS
jgi:hypothetical protein